MDPLLQVENLRVYYPVFGNFFQRLLGGGQKWVHAVDDVSFEIGRKEVVGLVGESGSGKSTIGRALLHLVEPTKGSIRFNGRDVTRVRGRDRKRLREEVQIIYQDPHAALNPAYTIGESLGEILRAHWPHVLAIESGGDGAATPKSIPRPTKAAVAERVLRLLEDVGLKPPEQFFSKLPSEISGGQKQRVVVARAVALRPKLIVADEPVALLDMSIRAKILELLLDLRERYGIAFLFITHDLATAKLVCERIAILYLGQIVEIGATRSVYADPKHPYTRALLQAIPVPDPAKRRTKVLPKGEVPDAVFPPAGCRFHPRCPVVTPTCGWEPRDVLDLLEVRAIDKEVAQKDWENLGPPGGMEVDVDRRTLLLPKGKDPEGMRTYLAQVIATGPPSMAAAIERTAVKEGRATVTFRAAEDPGLRAAGDRQVRCVLY